MWHRSITHNSLESTRGISRITSREEVDCEENGEEMLKWVIEESLVDGGGKEECLVGSACGQGYLNLKRCVHEKHTCLAPHIGIGLTTFQPSIHMLSDV